MEAKQEQTQPMVLDIVDIPSSVNNVPVSEKINNQNEMQVLDQQLQTEAQIEFDKLTQTEQDILEVLSIAQELLTQLSDFKTSSNKKDNLTDLSLKYVEIIQKIKEELNLSVESSCKYIPYENSSYDIKTDLLITKRKVTSIHTKLQQIKDNLILF